MDTSNPITEISFRIRNNLNDCYNALDKDNYDYIEGDIRYTCGGKFCAIGIKKYNDTKGVPITNIIGTFSKGREPKEIIQDGCTYKMIVDEEHNGDINNNSGGNNLYLYYTTDDCNKKPIRDLIYGNYANKKSSKQEVIQNSERSFRKYDLDLCTERSENFGYIYIIRV